MKGVAAKFWQPGGVSLLDARALCEVLSGCWATNTCHRELALGILDGFCFLDRLMFCSPQCGSDLGMGLTFTRGYTEVCRPRVGVTHMVGFV